MDDGARPLDQDVRGRSVPSPEDYFDQVRAMPRRLRYRYAGKTLKFSAYVVIETYAIVSALATLATLWLPQSRIESFILANVWGIAVAGFLHHVKLAGNKPWILVASIAAGFLAWAAYTWIVSRWIQIENFYAFAAIFAVFRYWDVAEDEIILAACQNLCESASSKLEQAPDA